jgi:alcohol dehydrogenase (cytochrome c)
MYVLDRVTGEFLKGKPYVKTNWLDGFDAKGRPNRVKFPTPEGTLVFPHVHGGTNWAPPSYSPRTGLFYVATWENSGIVSVTGQFPRVMSSNAQQTAMGQTTLVPFYNDATEPYGVVRAYDPKTLDQVWEFKMSDITWGGTLVTAGDVVFSGGREGYVLALDAKTGKLLWRSSVGGQVNAAAMSYAVNGRQFVAIAAGNALFAYALPAN